jgi:hypothetical protein
MLSQTSFGQGYSCNVIPPGIQMQKACRADISIVHGVSRGLGASKKIPEAQEA